MATTAPSMQTKVKQAYFDRTGEIMGDDFSTLIDVCTGIVMELLQNSVVTGEVIVPPGGSFPGATVPLTMGKIT